MEENIKLKQIRGLIQKIKDARRPEYKVVRPALLEIYQLDGLSLLGYKSFNKFCATEFGRNKRMSFAEEFSTAFFEYYVCGIPVGTLPKSYFVQSGFMKTFIIRTKEDSRYQLDKTVIHEAKLAWEKAKSYAVLRDRVMPNLRDMADAIREITGKDTYFHKSISAAVPVPKKEAELEDLMSQVTFLQGQIKILGSEITDMIAKRELLKNKENEIDQIAVVQEYMARQRSLMPCIWQFCINDIQRFEALKILINRGPSGCKEYLKALRDRVEAV